MKKNIVFIIVAFLVGGVIGLLVISVSLLQLRKASYPMLVTPSGMMIDVRLLHL